MHRPFFAQFFPVSRLRVLLFGVLGADFLYQVFLLIVDCVHSNNSLQILVLGFPVCGKPCLGLFHEFPFFGEKDLHALVA